MKRDDFDDQRKLGRTIPCAECPFRKKSLPGFFGGYGMEPYRQPPSTGLPTTCHMQDFGMHDDRSRLCAGACAVIANAEIEPLEGYAGDIARVGKRDDCFASLDDFVEHHESLGVIM